jgi:tripartite-type tricarboxylate transporter receptor subunit TctC
MLDLRAGRVSYMITSMVSSLNFERDGRARLLAVTGRKRSLNSACPAMRATAP